MTAGIWFALAVAMAIIAIASAAGDGDASDAVAAVFLLSMLSNLVLSALAVGGVL